MLLQRFPNGASGPSFFQKRVPDTRPDWLETTIVSTPNGTTSRALVAADLAHVLWAVNLGCLGFHVWPSQASDPEHADELRIDLDPSPGVMFPMVQEAAREVRALFDELGVMCLPKTTGNRGIHVYVRLQPRWTSYEVRSAAVAVARELERRRPDLITGAWWKEERGRRVFVDFNQNAPHKTIFGAWSVRARPGAQVSTPFAWEELETIAPDALTIVDASRQRVARDGDPWLPMSGRAAVARAAAGAARARHGGAARRRPWPPAVPEDARRAVAGRAEPGEEDRSLARARAPHAGRITAHAAVSPASMNHTKVVRSASTTASARSELRSTGRRYSRSARNRPVAPSRPRESAVSIASQYTALFAWPRASMSASRRGQRSVRASGAG